MTRYIDADAFAAEMKKRQDAAKEWLRSAEDDISSARADAVLAFLCEVKLTLDKAPTADVAPVVLCENCEHWNRGNISKSVLGNNVCLCRVLQEHTACDFYCACGERKDGGADK